MLLRVGPEREDEPRDYERLPGSGEALIHVAMSRPMARRLARSLGFSDGREFSQVESLRPTSRNARVIRPNCLIRLVGDVCPPPFTESSTQRDGSPSA
jgi:hypothetical protein